MIYGIYIWKNNKYQAYISENKVNHEKTKHTSMYVGLFYITSSVLLFLTAIFTHIYQNELFYYIYFATMIIAAIILKIYVNFVHHGQKAS